MSRQATPARPTRPARRGRLARTVPLLLVAWLVLEIWLVTVVAGWIGWFPTLLLLVAGVFLGGAVIKRAGARAFRAAVELSRDPQSAQPQTGTSMTVLAGLLLMVPGFLSDLLAVTFLLPPTRAVWRAVGRRITGSALRSATPVGADRFADAMRLQEQLRIHRPDGKVVQGEVVDPPAGPRGSADPSGSSGTSGPSGPDTGYRPPIAP
ncbi:FxsA family membrane protein [Kitasatospora sp. SolWspMP-SS2h]|uniref:FxsA family membrane protein n=1 Tax=Kitasatospora sp. SolWspMP-SS2h TaxID=1305729 RepID=UPI001F31DE0E|nr:FxsA family membrane protein [Kitasatospora sp. SolWspMP-SS2h]